LGKIDVSGVQVSETTFDQQPIMIDGQEVLEDWIDYNGHMNVAFYVLAFDRALDRVFDRIGIGVDYVARTNNSIFVLQNHVSYMNELKLGDPVSVSFQLLDHDAKRFHYFLRMYHGQEQYLAATAEQLAIHVNLDSRRSAPFPPDIAQNLATLGAAHARLPLPENAGARIGLTRKSAA
jgi:acyl-CoA thioester hydrolase